jgi:outer membrane protein assembly factor BamD
MKKYLLVILTSALLTACASAPKQAEVIGKDFELYNKGMSALYAKKYEKSINVFEELDRQHPYSRYSRKSQVMVIFAQFEQANYDEAIFAADIFIKSNIGYKDLDYVYYMKGLAYYYRISDTKRDQGYTEKSLEAFQELVNRFPKSKYAKDAEQKILLCLDHLAAKEMEVGRYYQNNGNMLAAVNRFQTVVNKYQKSSQTVEALYRIAEVYVALGLNDEAVRSLSILGYNYSGSSIWYKKGYDLLTNIDEYETKYQNEPWFEKFKSSLAQTLK